MADVTIIGAGPAGTIAAILLARRGWNVTLIEQQRFPRDKVCGECITPLAREVLARHGLCRAVAARLPTMLGRAALVASSGQHTAVDLRRPMWGLSRCALDDTLLAEARLTGARICQPARVESIYGTTSSVRNLQTNQTTQVVADRIIMADGKSALTGARPALTGDFGVKAHFEGVEDRTDTITLFGVNGHYVGLAAIEQERWNIAMSVPAARLKVFRGSLDALFQQVQKENAGLAGRFHRAERIGEWLVAPLPRYGPDRSWPANVIPVGNAAAALEPIGGEGIGLAMRSAEIAATALADKMPAAYIQQQFSALWRVRRPACRLLAQLLSRPAIADDIIALSRSSPGLSELFMGWMGKT